LYTQVHAVLQQARQQAKRNVNQVMVQAYWQVGRLSWSTNKPGPNGRPMALRRCKPWRTGCCVNMARVSVGNLRNFRQFFLTIKEPEIHDLPSSELSWIHFRLHVLVQDPDARKWYAREAVSQPWSVAALDRQISTLYYHRLLSSQHKDA
jgi:hypothetical protein